METIGESGGLIPPHHHHHHHHHGHHPIPGSGYFPSQDSSPSYFFPKTVSSAASSASSQGVFHGYSQTETQVHGMVFGAHQQQPKAKDRRSTMGGGDTEDRGRRNNNPGVGTGLSGLSEAVGERRYHHHHLPSSMSSSSSSSSSSLSPHHLHQQQQQQQHSMNSYYHHQHQHPQPSPTRGTSQFMSPLQHRLDEDNGKTVGKIPGNLPTDTQLSSRIEHPTLSPEKRSGKTDSRENNISEFSPLKKNPSIENSINSPFYVNKQGRQASSSYLNESRHANFETSVYPEMRESVKDVYESFSNGRNKDGDIGNSKPEAMPVAYDENEIQPQTLSSQHFREKLERSTSHDMAAARAATMSHRGDFPYDSHTDHQRPRAITMNSMFSNRRDGGGVGSGGGGAMQNSFYPGKNNSSDLIMFQKMRDHFNQSNLNSNPYFYRHDSQEKELLSPLSPSSLSTGGGRSGSGHQRRLSGGGEVRTPSRQDLASQFMMAPPGKFHQQEGRSPFQPPPMMHTKHPQQQHPHHHKAAPQHSNIDKDQQPTSVSNNNTHVKNKIGSPPSGGKSFELIDNNKRDTLSSQSPVEGNRTTSPRMSPLKGGGRMPGNDVTSEPSNSTQWGSSKADPGSNPDDPEKQNFDKSFASDEDISESSSFPDNKVCGQDQQRAKASSSTPKHDVDVDAEDDDDDDDDDDDAVQNSNDNYNSYNHDNNSNPCKEDSSSTLSLKGESPPTTPPPRKLSSDSPDDNSLPDALPRELMPKKEMFSDDGEEDSYHGSGHYAPMTPPSPTPGGVGYPSFQHQHQPFFPSPERFPSQVPQPHPFGPPPPPPPHHNRGIADGGQGIPPGFPFNKDIHGRFPMPGLGPPGGSFMGQIPIRMEGEKDVYFCHLCSYSGKSKSDFDGHMSIHFEYNCPHCDYTSRTEGRLKRHIKDFHTDDSSRRSMPGRPKVFKCKQCSFSATEKDKFWEHARSHIKEDKLLQCPKCPFVTEYKHHLEYHLRNHFGSKPFKCNKCNYSCVNKSMLNSHMKSHTNVYQYRCSDCTYATKYCHSLKLHLRKYNHKPATVLNQDGSLPQGIDADTSGLSVNTKRGPPRGPRGPRKDKNDPYFGQMFGGVPPPMGMGMGIPSAVNPMLKGMIPFWPVLQHGMGPGHPGMLPGLPAMPQHMGMRVDGGVDMRDRPGGLDRSDPDMSDMMMSGEDSPGKDEDDSVYLPCRLCDFIGDSTEALCLHLLKVHKDETGEMANMYGINETALAESMERAKRAKMERNGQRIERRMSEISAESERELPDFRRRNTIAGLLSRDNPEYPMGNPEGKPFWSSPFSPRGKHLGVPRIQELCYMDDGNDDGENENDSGSGGMDILQQMTLKFGGVIPQETGKSREPVTPSKESNEQEEQIRGEEKLESQKKLPGHKESPLDLTKPKSVSPPMFSNPNSPRRLYDFNSEEDEVKPIWMEPGRGSELDKLTETLVRKRQITELEENCSNSAGTTLTPTEKSCIVPRKRSRKGKAYKLETLCMKLQEHIPRSSNESDVDSDNENYNHGEKCAQLQSNQVPNESQSKEIDEETKENSQNFPEKREDKDDNVVENIGSDSCEKVETENNMDKENMVKIVEENSEEDKMDVECDIMDEDKKTEENKNEKLNVEKDESVEHSVENDDDEKACEKEEDLENFEKLQETLNSFNEKIKQEKSGEIDNTTDGISIKAEEKVKDQVIEIRDEVQFNFDDDDDGDDDDDDDAKTEILGEENEYKDVFDLSDKENSSDVLYSRGLNNEQPPSSEKVVPLDDVEIEEKVDMINTVIENRKKPLPPAVRRGTELAWKLLNDPVNPVTSIPIPVVSPPMPDWKTQQPPSPSPIACTSSTMATSPLNISNMASPMKNGMRMSGGGGVIGGGIPFSPNQKLPPPPPTKPHLPITLPPTPMAFIPPTNRILPPPPEHHQMSLPPPPPLPVSKPAPKDMYECTYCDLSFRDCVMYTVHMGYHSNRNPFKCNSCGIICRDKVEFFLHIARSPHS